MGNSTLESYGILLFTDPWRQMRGIEALAFLLHIWTYNAPMKIVNFPEMNYAYIGASGPCPYCPEHGHTYFHPVQSAVDGNNRMAEIVKCEVCKGYALIVAKRPSSGSPWQLSAFYPMGSAPDRVDASIPGPIASDYLEGIRCRFVNAYRATVVMCRRALQASAIAMGANKDAKLNAQIKELFTKGKITETLRDFATEVRLVGNDGAHPDPDGLENIGEKDADDILVFTAQYFTYVYVMPAKLKARREPPSTVAAPSN
jgi:hypothetical protein